MLNGRELRRSYSMSSSPESDQFIAITIKKVVNGEVSRYLLEHVHKGTRLLALEPSGRFTIETNSNNQRDIFLFAAGSGITPVFSLLKKILNEEPASNVILVTQNRNEDSVIFRKELTEMQNRFANQMTWKSFLGSPSSTGVPVRRLNIDLLTELIHDQLRYEKKETLFYTCGPIAFMRMTEFTVRQLRFSEAQVRKEIFVLPAIPVISDLVDPASRKITIRFNDKIYNTTVSYPSSILDAARRIGVNIPFSCKAGVCSTCVAKCKKGKVSMKLNEVLTEEDLAAGLILTCVGYAETDLELEI